MAPDARGSGCRAGTGEPARGMERLRLTRRVVLGLAALMKGKYATKEEGKRMQVRPAS